MIKDGVVIDPKGREDLKFALEQFIDENEDVFFDWDEAIEFVDEALQEVLNDSIIPC